MSDNDGGVTTGQTDVLVMTAQQGIEELLIERINGLAARGALNKGQVNSLLSMLNAAIQQLNLGAHRSAGEILEAFLNKLQGLSNGQVLVYVDVAPLVENVNRIRACL